MNTQNKLPISIDRARYWALTTPSVAFYGSLAAQLSDRIADEGEGIDTAATNGNQIIWNVAWVAQLTDAEVRFVLLHEALHCAHGHFWRLPIDDEGNQAGDYAINATLEKIPGITMPKGGLRDTKYDAMAEEEILAAIRKAKQKPQPQGQKPQQGQGQPQKGQGGLPGKDPGQCGGFQAPAPTAGQTAGNGKGPQSQQEKWQQAVVQADMVAKSLGRGSAPADMQRILDRVKTMAEVDWKQETADFVRSVVGSKVDQSHSKRNAQVGDGLPWYPRRGRKDNVGLVIFARDTSGSIDKALCDEFTAQIGSVTAELNCESIVVDCDTKIHAEYRLGAGEEAPLNAKGGGGTDFDPVFDRIAQLVEEGEKIAGVVYLTDGDGSFTDKQDTAYSVLWAVYGSSGTDHLTAGRVIRVK
jgi:predicted metal-dependent peptidase